MVVEPQVFKNMAQSKLTSISPFSLRAAPVSRRARPKYDFTAVETLLVVVDMLAAQWSFRPQKI